jgi:hypothetical protein
MKWELSVPKMAHFYWGGGKLLYMRFLSIKSFMKYNPDWVVVFHYPRDGVGTPICTRQRLTRVSVRIILKTC